MSNRKARVERRLARRQAAEPRQEEDRRQQQRRMDPPLTGEELERRLRELGIAGDRRRANRRTQGERRR